MPVTFSEERNQHSAYVDPAFRYDSSTRLLGREQFRDNVAGNQNSHSKGKGSRASTPLLEYNRSYFRSGSPDSEVNNNALSLNVARDDQACYDTTAGLQDANSNNFSFETEDLSRLTSQQREDSNPAYRDGIRLRDFLANKAFYTTSTQKLYQGVDWCNRVTRSPAPPRTSKELNADTVSYRYESKRYEPRNENWQQFGSRPFSWDYVQTRDGHHIPGPVRFCSPHRKIPHIPGYMGHVSGGPGEMDNPNSFFNSANKQRTLKPRYTDTARKGNIPGYAGRVLFYDYQPACINDPEHLRSTTASTYRPHDEVQCNNRSPFKKLSPMSRLVTLTHPFNPFNKLY